jgi:hypothetical protein
MFLHHLVLQDTDNLINSTSFVTPYGFASDMTRTKIHEAGNAVWGCKFVSVRKEKEIEGAANEVVRRINAGE